MWFRDIRNNCYFKATIIKMTWFLNIFAYTSEDSSIIHYSHIPQIFKKKKKDLVFNRACIVRVNCLLCTYNCNHFHQISMWLISQRVTLTCKRPSGRGCVNVTIQTFHSKMGCLSENVPSLFITFLILILITILKNIFKISLFKRP